VRRGIITQASEGWPRDSLFCEYGYLLDLDQAEPVFEAYKGFRTLPPTGGQWKGEPVVNGCAPVELIEAVPLWSLPADEAAEAALIKRWEDYEFPDQQP